MVFSTPNLLVPVLSALKLHTNLNLIIKKNKKKTGTATEKMIKNNLLIKSSII